MKRSTKASKIQHPAYLMNLKTNTTTPSSQHNKKMPILLTLITRRRPLLHQSMKNSSLNYLQARKISNPPSLLHLPGRPAPPSPRSGRLPSSRERVSPSIATTRRSKSLVKAQLPQLLLPQAMIRVVVRVVVPAPDQAVVVLLPPIPLLLSPTIRTILSRRHRRPSLRRITVLLRP